MTLQITIGGIDLAGLNGVDSNGVQWSVASLDGWGGVVPTIQLVQKPRASGAWSGLSYGGPRHLSIAGLIAAPTQDLLSAAVDSLVRVTSLAATTLTIVEGSRTRFLSVRREDEVLFTYLTDTVAQYSIAVVAADPRKLGPTLVGTTLLPSSTGGLTVPFTVPFAINSTLVSGTVSLINQGTTVGPVILRIDGPCTGPQITHQGLTGGSINFSASLVLGAGEWLTINMDTRQVLANDQANRAQYITNRGWSGFDPGANTWAFTSAIYNAASQLTVTVNSAWD